MFMRFCDLFDFGLKLIAYNSFHFFEAFEVQIDVQTSRFRCGIKLIFSAARC